MSTFSERISALMEELKLTQKQLANMAGVTESAMSYYLKGLRTPRSDVLARIASALNTSTDYLLGTEQRSNHELRYIQRNLGKLDEEQLKRAEIILKAAFNNIFEDQEDDNL